MDHGDPIVALMQQIRGDQLMGLRFLPLSLDALDTLARLRGDIKNIRSSGETIQVGLEERIVRLTALQDQVRNCRKCDLCRTRTQTVFGQGNPRARVVFVGEGPGYEEDQQGLAFVGPSGQLLTKMIVAMGLTRDDVFICNVVKCRPPQNRTPAPEEIEACNPFLREQLKIIAPEVIVALGAPATQTLLNTGIPIGRLRGRFHDYYLSGQPGDGPAIPVMPTYHPSYLLRTPGDKGKTWDDLKQVMARLDLPLPKA